jgi:SAM-dependent methyltransferase
MTPMTSSFLDESYDDFPRIEEAFQAYLDESLHPRGPDLLYEIVGELGLPADARVLDLGCGEGQHSIRLAEKFRVAVHGIDPVPRHMELANQALDQAASRDPELRKLVRFELGAAESVPTDDASVDLIWCRNVLVLVSSLDKAFAECHRVLRTRGHMLIYDTLRTDRLEPREAEWLRGTLEMVPANAYQDVEAAFAGAGFEIDQRIELGSEWGEYAEEHTGHPSRQLLHAARLLRSPERYIAQFGQKNYDIMLGDSLWHVYRMIGKLSSRVYVLKLS